MPELWHLLCMHILLLLVLPNKENHIAKVTELKNVVVLFVQVRLRPIFSFSFTFIQKVEVSKDCSARSKVKSNSFRSFLLLRHQKSLLSTLFFSSLYMNSWWEFPFLWGTFSFLLSRLWENLFTVLPAWIWSWALNWVI